MTTPNSGAPMSADVERLLAEDEAARAGVDAAETRARDQIARVRAEIAAARAARLAELERQVGRTIADIGDAGEREAERRRTVRNARARERAQRASALVTDAAAIWVRIVRCGSGTKDEP